MMERVCASRRNWLPHNRPWPILFTPPAWKVYPLTRGDWPPKTCRLPFNLLVPRWIGFVLRTGIGPSTPALGLSYLRLRHVMYIRLRGGIPSSRTKYLQVSDLHSKKHWNSFDSQHFFTTNSPKNNRTRSSIPVCLFQFHWRAIGFPVMSVFYHSSDTYPE